MRRPAYSATPRWPRAELTASIGDSRYYASRYAATGDEAEIARAQATPHPRQGTTGHRPGEIGRGRPRRRSRRWTGCATRSRGFESELAALQNSVHAYGPSAGGNSLAAAINISGEQLAEQARGVEQRLARGAATTADALAALNRWLAMIVIGLLAVAIVVTIVGARFVGRTTAGSIREITRAMSALAGGDRTVAVPGTGRRDEIGEMARALAVFRQSAHNLAQLQEQAAAAARAELSRQEAERDREQAERARKAEHTRELALRFERTVGEVVGGVAAASAQLQTTASSMAAAATQSAQLTREVSRSMSDATSGVTAAASASDQFALSIGQISRLATNSAALAQDARVSAQNADGTIAGLTDAAEEVGQIVDLIGSIARRTSLLALNASIEAARSSEAGRGFAVVAAEVKDLAGQTSAATGKVAEQICAIQGSTGDSVAALRQIGERVREMEAGATAIAQSVDEQSVASHDLARNLLRAAGGTSEIGASIDQLSDTTQLTGTAAEQVLEAARELHRQAEVLRHQVEEFLGYVRAGVGRGPHPTATKPLRGQVSVSAACQLAG